MVPVFQTLSSLYALLFPIAMIAAAATDIASYKIPNRLSVVLIIGFFGAAVLARLSPADIALHAAVAAAALCFGLLAFAMRWMGGGDGKFLAACALWFGPSDILPFALAFSLIGGLLALTIVGLRRIPLPVPLSRHKWLLELWTASNGIPYGLAFAIGGLLVYPQSELWSRLISH